MAPDTPDPAPEAPAARGALTGKAALITGAARRVGASIARMLHAAGADVVLHYRSSADDADALMHELNDSRRLCGARGMRLLEVHSCRRWWQPRPASSGAWISW